jgi:hypothetical protein
MVSQFIDASLEIVPTDGFAFTFIVVFALPESVGQPVNEPLTEYVVCVDGATLIDAVVCVVFHV